MPLSIPESSWQDTNRCPDKVYSREVQCDPFNCRHWLLLVLDDNWETISLMWGYWQCYYWLLHPVESHLTCPQPWKYPQRAIQSKTSTYIPQEISWVIRYIEAFKQKYFKVNFNTSIMLLHISAQLTQAHSSIPWLWLANDSPNSMPGYNLVQL